MSHQDTHLPYLEECPLEYRNIRRLLVELGHVVSVSSDWAGSVTRLHRVPGDETEGCWSIFEG